MVTVQIPDVISSYIQICRGENLHFKLIIFNADEAL